MEKKSLKLSSEIMSYIEFESEKPTLVLIHGNMSSSMHYSSLFEELGKNYHVLAMDLRGFGDTSYNHRFDSLNELAEDVKEFLDLKNIKKAHLVGWSTGAGIALELASSYPDLVQSVFSIEGVGHTGYPIFKKDVDGNPIIGESYKSKEEMATDPIQVANMMELFETNNKEVMNMIWQQLIYTVNQPSVEENEQWLEETMKQRNLIDVDWALANFNLSNQSNGYTSGTNKIDKIQCPCAFTTGDKDLVVPRNMVEATAKAIPESTLICYENCGHSPLVDKREKLLEDILSFCK